MKRTFYMILVCVTLLFSFYSSASADTVKDAQSLIVYPEYDARIPKCFDYGVSVHQGDRSEKLIVYNRNANGEQMSNRCFKPDFNRRFCEFAFTGEVRVDIEVYQDFKSYSILPSAKNYRNEYHDGIISVWLDQNDTNFMVRLDDDDATILSVFADAPEEYQFDPDDSSVLYVDEKWYDPNGSELVYNVPEHIKTIYIAPGCVLYSRLLIKTNDVTVCGHGILADPFSDYYDTQSIGVDNDRMVVRVEGSNITIRDIKLIDTQNWNIYLYSGYNHSIYDVKILTARITTDAVAVGTGNVEIENCVFYVSDNVFTYNGDRGYHHIKNCLIGTTCAAFFPQHESRYEIDFTDIYVFRANEGIVNNWYNPARHQSQIKHITFKNLDCVDMVHTPWIFNAHDMGDADKYFTFDNCHFANIRGDSNIEGWDQTIGQAIYVVSRDGDMHCGGYRLEFFNCTLDGNPITEAEVFHSQLPDGDEIAFDIQYDSSLEMPTRQRICVVNHVYDKKVYIGEALQPLQHQPAIIEGVMYLPEREICRALGVKSNPETTGISIDSVKYVSISELQRYEVTAAYDADKNAVCISPIKEVKLNLLEDVTYTTRWNPHAYPNVILGPYVDTDQQVVLRCDVNVVSNYAGMFTEITQGMKKTGAGTYTISFDAKSVDGKNYPGEVRVENINYEGYQEMDRREAKSFTATPVWQHFELPVDLAKWSTTEEYLSFVHISSAKTPDYDVLFKNIKMIKNDATREVEVDNEDEIGEPENGETGETGKQPGSGEAVDDGKQPENGETGETGKQPGTGETGETGKQPENGETGETGKQPESGETGDTGKQPESGETGETEKQPESGETGDTGKQPGSGEAVDDGKQPESGTTGDGENQSNSDSTTDSVNSSVTSGNDSGSVQKDNKINLAKPSIKKLQSKKGKIYIKWKIKAKQGAYFKIQYSLKKNFKKKKTVMIKSTKKRTAVLKKCKRKKTYYVRICAYKKVKGKTYQGAWSKVKKVTVK